VKRAEDSNSEQVRGVVCYLGIGSNLGQPAEQCLEAVKRIAAVDGITHLRCSSLYKTEPVGEKKTGRFCQCRCRGADYPVPAGASASPSAD